jgi:hypothetical protein
MRSFDRIARFCRTYRRGSKRELLVRLVVQPLAVYYVGEGRLDSPVGLRVDNRTPNRLEVDVFVVESEEEAG